jgi:hypothetical protein
MPRMKILSPVEQDAFDSPPVFNSVQRKQYFDFPVAIQSGRWPPNTDQSALFPGELRLLQSR